MLNFKNLDHKNLDHKNLDHKNLDHKNLDHKNLDHKNLDHKKYEFNLDNFKPELLNIEESEIFETDKLINKYWKINYNNNGSIFLSTPWLVCPFGLDINYGKHIISLELTELSNIQFENNNLKNETNNNFISFLQNNKSKDKFKNTNEHYLEQNKLYDFIKNFENFIEKEFKNSKLTSVIRFNNKSGFPPLLSTKINKLKGNKLDININYNDPAFYLRTIYDLPKRSWLQCNIIIENIWECINKESNESKIGLSLQLKNINVKNYVK